MKKNNTEKYLKKINRYVFFLIYIGKYYDNS